MNDQDKVGLVGSPSTTGKATVDIVEDASATPLHGQLVYLTHSLGDKSLIAIGTVTEVTTSNRWHEDANMRGVLKRHGSLPHLSEVGDVRTADLLVQAAYAAAATDPSEGEPPMESGGALSMSPTTGSPVCRVTDEFLTQLLRRHAREITYLGSIYRSEVRLPLKLRHFGPEAEGGSGEAYHSGIFGMTGSGKSVLAAYLIAAYSRHSGMGILIMDPQGQFTTEEGLPFSIEDWATRRSRGILKYSISSDLRLPQDAPTLGVLLGVTPFFESTLGVRAGTNREAAVAEFTRALRSVTKWDKEQPTNVLRAVLTQLVNDDAALKRIYSSKESRDRLASTMQNLLDSSSDFAVAMESFAPLHNLFAPKNEDGDDRTNLLGILYKALSVGKTRPLVILDFSGRGDELLDSAPVKARLLHMVCSRINVIAEQAYKKGESLNTLVVFDEAQRFAPQEPENDEAGSLAASLVDYVRTTRKYGLGWMFITQETGSLRRGIYTQLRVRSFGYGLTSGSERTRLRETIGDEAALDLYRSFVDPQAIAPAQYPFMLTGPVSPLSFTGAPVFLSVYTDFQEFCVANEFASPSEGGSENSRTSEQTQGERRNKTAPALREGQHWEVDPETGCWNWLGFRLHGYGRCQTGQAHREVWRQSGRELRRDQDLHHVCRNRACVNPQHLSLEEPGPHRASHRREFTYEQLAQIREMAADASLRVIDIANRLGVPRTSVQNIIEGKRYAEYGIGQVRPVRECLWCGCPIEGRRRHARFCSAEHRRKYNSKKLSNRRKAASAESADPNHGGEDATSRIDAAAPIREGDAA